MPALLAACAREPERAPPAPPKVTVMHPVRRPVTEYLETTGNTHALNTVQLRARVEGTLEQVLFRDGQPVERGQLLYVIQRNTYIAQLRQAQGQLRMYKAQLVYARKQLRRYAELLPHKAASRSDVDEWRYQRDSAAANVRIARAQVKQAKLNLGYTKVTAPFDGRIDRNLVDAGNLVGAGGTATVLVEVNQINPIHVYFTLTDRQFSRLAALTGELPRRVETVTWPTSVGLPEEEGYPHAGKLDFAAITFTPTTGTLLMRVVLPNPDGLIMAGLYARVRIPLAKKPLLLVPAEAVSHDMQGAYVLIVNAKNVVERRSVTTGPKVGRLQAIETGLTAEDWVVVNGLQRAVPGHTVTPVRGGPPAEKAPPPLPTDPNR